MANEYSDVIRVALDIQVPPGYKFLDAKQSVNTTQYAREMTLARGRILYEVWDNWTSVLRGYLIPSQILSETITHRSGPSLQSWSTLRNHERNARKHAHTLILEQFPRIHPMPAKIVAERMITEKRTVTPRNVEQNIVNHVRHCWTSYEFRLEQSGSKKVEVLEVIKERMRDVLGGWMDAEIEGAKLVKFWKRHWLLDREEGKGSVKESDVVYRASRLSWFAGAETVGNLVAREDAYL